MGSFGKKERSIIINVEGMTCMHCKMRVTKALKKVEGVKTAKVSLEKKEAEVVFEGAKVDDDVLVKAVEDAGYQFSGFKGEANEGFEEEAREKSLKERWRFLMGGGIGFFIMVTLMIVLFLMPGAFSGSGIGSLDTMLLGIPFMIIVMIIIMMIFGLMYRKKS